MSKVLITGGSGYFGSLLLQKLLAAGKNCVVLDINDSDDRPKEVEFLKIDIRDLEKVRKACKGMETVYHSVAQVPLAKDKKAFDSVNRIGTENLLDAALENGVKKVICLSSSAVFGVPKLNPVTETTEPHPQESYGRAKLDGEKCCVKYIEQGLDVTIIRPRTIMGHGRLGIFQILFEWIRNGDNVPVLGKGDNIYQFVHADDLADACILAAQRPGSRIYNCGTDRFGTMREVLENLCSHAQSGSKVRSIPMGPAIAAMKVSSIIGVSPLGAYHALMYGRSMYFDISCAKNELLWQPKYSNNEMFLESYDWYLRNRESVLSVGANVSHHRSPVKEGILALVRKMI